MGTDFTWFLNILKCCGALSASFDPNKGKFIPNYWMLLYSLACITLHQIIFTLNHSNLVFLEFSKKLSFKQFLYKCDIICCFFGVVSFMFINSYRHKGNTKVLNRLLEIDTKFGHCWCSHRVDRKLRRVSYKISKIILMYAIFTLVINSLESRDHVFNAAPSLVKSCYYISSMMVYLSRSLFDTFLILKISFSLSGITKNIQALKFKEQVHEYVTVIDEYYCIINYYTKQLSLGILIQVLSSFLLLSLVAFYNFEMLLKSSISFDEWIALVNSIAWNLLLIPTYLNCSLYGKMQIEVGINKQD